MTKQCEQCGKPMQRKPYGWSCSCGPSPDALRERERIKRIVEERAAMHFRLDPGPSESVARSWQTVGKLWIPGVPVPQGSKQAYVPRNMKRAVLVDANKEKLRPWRAQVSSYAIDAWGGRPPLDEDVCVFMEFVFPRPAAHFGSGKNAQVLKPSAPFYKNTKPDKDKLERAINDALTDAGVLRDDCRVVDGGSRKIFGSKPGARVTIQTMKESGDAG